MNKYNINENNYFIFDKESDQYMVYFLWGKFDFRLFFRIADEAEAKKVKKLGYQDQNGKFFVPDKLQHKLFDEWYDFKKVTSHGFTFEEVQWVYGKKVHFAEFPKDLLVNAAKLSAMELDLTPLA